VYYPTPDFYGPAPLPAEPTKHPPGSPEKEKVLFDRRERGEQLHHPDDFTEAVWEGAAAGGEGGWTRLRGDSRPRVDWAALRLGVLAELMQARRPLSAGKLALQLRVSNGGAFRSLLHALLAEGQVLYVRRRGYLPISATIIDEARPVKEFLDHWMPRVYRSHLQQAS
jgi:hypothetical protein